MKIVTPAPRATMLYVQYPRATMGACCRRGERHEESCVESLDGGVRDGDAGNGSSCSCDNCWCHHCTRGCGADPRAPARIVRRARAAPIELGSSDQLAESDSAIFATAGGIDAASSTVVVSKRRFAGYWEYMIDDALFTSPPRFDHSGAALIDRHGKLVGVGSLVVADVLPPTERNKGAEKVSKIKDCYRELWKNRKAGDDVPLTVLQGSEVRKITVQSIDRAQYAHTKTSI